MDLPRKSLLKIYFRRWRSQRFCFYWREWKSTSWNALNWGSDIFKRGLIFSSRQDFMTLESFQNRLLFNLFTYNKQSQYIFIILVFNFDNLSNLPSSCREKLGHEQLESVVFHIQGKRNSSQQTKIPNKRNHPMMT